MAKTQYEKKRDYNKPTTSDENTHVKEGFTQKRARKQFKFNKKARLIVRNLSFKTNEDNLRKHFESYGEIQEVIILKRANGELVGCGFVQFKTTTEAANALLKTNAQKFLGRPIHVDWAVAKDAYVRHLNEQADPENVEVKIEKTEEGQAKFDVNSVPVKEEPESENEDIKNGLNEDVKTKSESDDEASQSDNSDSNDSNDESMEESIEEVKPQVNLKKSANDATDGKTVFIKNVPFDATNDDLRTCMEQFGQVAYALICIDKMTEHSKGTAFVRFKEEESAQRCLSSGTELTLLGQVLDPHPALSREQANSNHLKSKEKPLKDSRNLYLIKEGVVLAGTKAAEGVSMADMEKRLQLEHSKSQMLRNLNRYVSRFRLTIHNLPDDYDDAKLRTLCSSNGCTVREARVMRDTRPTVQELKGRSKGFGFVSFASHEDALATLRRLNNNPTIFSKKKRPIVAFSIEDKAAMNAKQKRQQKSLLQNPNNKLYNMNKGNMKNVMKFESKNTHKNKSSNVIENMETGEYAGVTAKPGLQKMRTKFGLKTQAKIHIKNLKTSKKQLKGAKKSLAERKTEHIRQPSQKQNNKNKAWKEDVHFSKLVNEYKDKLSQGMKRKSKWYE